MKKILISNSNAIHHLFFKGMRESGYLPIPWIDADFEQKKKLSLIDKIENVARKLVGKERPVREQLYIKTKLYKKNRFSRLLKDNNTFDGAFIISPQSIERPYLIELLRLADKKVAYHWDGIYRYPEMIKNDDLFDRVYVFDPSNVDNKKYFFATNCYFDDPNTSYHKELDVYYNTFFAEDKVKILQEMLYVLPMRKNVIKVRVFNGKEEEYTRTLLGDSCEITNHTEEYESILGFTQKAKVLLDIKAEEHNGLSFRFFEALCYECKIITNNKYVQDYDFFRPENIIIWNPKITSDEVSAFLATPYQPIEDSVRLQYYFPVWFERIMNF